MPIPTLLGVRAKWPLLSSHMLKNDVKAAVHAEASLPSDEPHIFRLMPSLFTQGEDDGTTLVPVAQYLEAREGEKPLGVYALYDTNRNLQYVGYGRNIILAAKVTHTCLTGM